MRSHVLFLAASLAATATTSGCLAPTFTCETGGTVTDEKALRAAAQCEVVTGNVALEAGGLAAGRPVRFTNLRELRGQFSLTYSAAGIVPGELFPALETATDTITFSGASSMRKISLPKLERAARIDIVSNPDLLTVELPSLQSVTALDISANTALESVVVGTDVHADDVTFDCNGSLETTGALTGSFSDQVPASAVSGDRRLQTRTQCSF